LFADCPTSHLPWIWTWTLYLFCFC
jgi:hypothetical protein